VHLHRALRSGRVVPAARARVSRRGTRSLPRPVA
jgi:hypothetical protein